MVRIEEKDRERGGNVIRGITLQAGERIRDEKTTDQRLGHVKESDVERLGFCDNTVCVKKSKKKL